jgi:hypothetical protein
MGKHDEAADTLSDVLAVQTRVLGAEHPNTIMSTSSLATTLFHLGKRDEAVQLKRDVVAARTRLLGNEALAVLLSKGDLQCMLEALHQHQQSDLGEGHPKTLHTLRELVTTTWELRGYEEAIGRQKLLVSAARRAGHDSRQHEADLRDMVRRFARRENAPAAQDHGARGARTDSILGARVVVNGPMKRKRGTVLSLPADGHLYTVKLDSGGTLRLRREGMCVLCSGCAKRSDAARACGKCRSAWYCSVECQRASWPAHKPACKPAG